MSCLYNVSTVGIIGNIAFGQGADPIRNIKIERIQGRASYIILSEYLFNPYGNTFLFVSPNDIFHLQ